VIPLTLAELAEITAAVGGRLAPGTDGAIRVTAPATVDSRTVEPGGLFVALPGEHADGHDFAARAVAAGAAGVLATRDVGVPAVLVDDGAGVTALGALARHVVGALPKTTVTALTGSSGKTSTKDLLAQVLEHVDGASGDVVATAASFNNEIGLPLTVLRATPATAHLVLEMGARGVGHIAYLCGVAPPRVAGVLNIGTAHVGGFGDRAGIARAKGEIVEALPGDGAAVLFADDPLTRSLAARTKAPVTFFGRSADGLGPVASSGPRRDDADVRAENVRLDAACRAEFDLCVGGAGGDRAPVRLRLVGEHQVDNALAAAAFARAAVRVRGGDVGAAQLADALSAAEPRSRWRMEVTDRADGVTIINDAYNANPESMRAGLKALAVMARNRPPGARSWAVLGEMLELGAAAREKHDAVGRLAVRLDVNRLVVVGEGAAHIHNGAALEGSWGAESVKVADPDAAIALLRRELRAGDVVLVKASHSVGLERVAEALLEGAA
jgi:UDP-N-acetylmuramoyl-tripeptide--D-alanyl-D-alanine ligase